MLHNNSPDSLGQIELRLDPNIFLGNTPQAATWVPSEVTDGMVITRMTINGQSVNLAGPPPAGGDGARAAQAAAAAQNAQVPNQPTILGLRTTTARVNLPTKIAPRSTTTLEIEWNHKIPGGPGVGHRMTQRWADTLYQPTQWYPRVAVYDDLRGWDTELYLGPSEFYNNFGRFDVRLDVPAGWIVSGTGVLQNPEEVLTPNARERHQARARRTTDHDDRRPRRGRARSGDAARRADRWRRRRPPRLALRRRHRERLRVGDGEEVRVGDDARDDPGEGPDPDHHGLSAGSRAASTTRRARSRVTRSSSTRSSGSRISSRSSRCRMDRARAWSTRW